MRMGTEGFPFPPPARRRFGEAKWLHAAGIEVILDVVYNHTSEGNHMGPMLSFRGVDDSAYDRLVQDDKLQQTVSPSRLTLFLQCRLKFWFRYVARIA